MFAIQISHPAASIPILIPPMKLFIDSDHWSKYTYMHLIRYTHIFEEEKQVKMSSNVPDKTKGSLLLRRNFSVNVRCKIEELIEDG